MALGLILTSCVLAGAFVAVPAAEASIPDHPLAVRHESQSKPAPIPQVHRVKKATGKRRGAALAAVRKRSRLPGELLGSSLKTCGGPAEPSSQELRDDPLDDEASLDELEIEWVSLDPYYYDDQKRTPALLVRVTRALRERLEYATDTSAPRVEDRDRAPGAVGARTRVRLLPRLPSSDDDGSASA